MKHQQCEWCEAIATRVFIANNEGYRRFSCEKAEHAERVRRLMSNDGITEWAEKTSEVPFEIEDQYDEGDLPTLFEGGFFYK